MVFIFHVFLLFISKKKNIFQLILGRTRWNKLIYERGNTCKLSERRKENVEELFKQNSNEREQQREFI